jgi:hypothetical protein
MNSQRLSELFDALVDERTSPERRRDIEAELAEDATGRRLLAARDAFQAPPEALPPSDLAPRVLGGLPDLPPGARWTLADVVVSGWVDPALRAELWRDPRAVLAARGLVFPEHVEVVAVPLGNAHLPHAGRVALPLPPPGGRAVPEAEALRQLGASDFGWLWGPTWARTEVAVPAERAPWSRAVRRLAPALALAAAVAAVVWLAVAMPTPGADMSGLSGAAGGSAAVPTVAAAPGVVAPVATAWPTWLVVAMVFTVTLALAGAWLWGRRR